MSKQQRGSLSLRGNEGGTFHVYITVIIVMVGEEEVDAGAACAVVVVIVVGGGVRRRGEGVGARREMVGACAFIHFLVLLLCQE